MPAEFRSLETRFMVRELRDSLLGGKFQKIYQYGAGEKCLLFDVYVSTKGSFLLFTDGGKMFITKSKREAPETPPNFCMLLRKYLAGATIKDIRQHGFDRIIEIATDNSILVFEFIPPGNVILCDRFYNIIVPLSSQRWKDRVVLPKTPYRPPPCAENPYNISSDTFARAIAAAGDEKAGSFIAKLGFGPAYSDEICSRAGIEPSRACSALLRDEVLKIFGAMREMGESPARPVTYADGTVFPFPLTTRKDPVKSEWPTLSAPLDEVSVAEASAASDKKRKDAADGVKGRLQRIVGRQVQASERLAVKKEEDKKKADAIYEFYGLTQDVLDGLKKARESGLSWEQIKERIAGGDVQAAKAIREIKEREGKVAVELGEKVVELDMRKTAGENAASYYEGSKEARRKYGGAQAAIAEKLIEIEGAETDAGAEPPAESPVAAAAQKKARARKPKVKWYERFRWFFSSKRFLIVAGKDAATNEELVKKYTEPGDIVFHTDIQGSAFTVIKVKTPKGTKFAGITEGGTVPLEVKKEASEVAAAYSKAWSQGLGNIDVYAVKPEQVSKTPPSGTSLAKGSFMIYGQREWFRDVEVKMAIGVLVDRATKQAEVISGSVMGMRAYCKYFVTVRPGSTPATALAKEVRDRLGYKASPEDRVLIEQIPLESIERLIPSGTGMLVT